MVSSFSTLGGSYFGVGAATVVFAAVGAFIPVVVVLIPVGFAAGVSFGSFVSFAASGYFVAIAVDGRLSPVDVAGFGYGVVELEPLFWLDLLVLLLLGVVGLLSPGAKLVVGLVVIGLAFPIVDVLYFGSSLSFAPLTGGVGLTIDFTTPVTPVDNFDLIDCWSKF